jgi:hypothetical protein
MQICGREISEGIVDRIRCRVQGDPTLTRTGLSREVAAWLDWRDARGRVKEMSCRVALLKLARRGLIELPSARAVSFGPRAARSASPVAPTASIEMTLTALGPIELVLVDGAEHSGAWRELMAHHPLGAGPLCGAQLRYLVRSAAGYLGALSFSAAAWRLAARERFIGWDEATRRARLPQVVNNSRFLILPTVKVPNLASHVLSLAERRLAQDWQARYGVQPVLLETFVDSTLHAGTCYRAANWIEIGATRGRGRQDRARTARGSAKRIFVRPLCSQWRGQLAAQGAPPVAASPAPPADWAEQEFGQAQLPDARLKRRLLTLARDFYARPSANVPQACGSRARTKAAYRFFDHPKTTMQELLAGHTQATVARLQREPVVLAVQDTTSLNYTAHAATEGLGPICNRVDGPQGLEVHSTLAFTPQGTPLGLLDVQCWARDANDFGKKVRRKRTPIEQKESYKWLKSYEATAKTTAQRPATQIVSVGDREADIYELFELAAHTDHGPQLLVRAEHNRALANEQERLWPTLQAQPLAGTLALAVPRQGNRKARRAQLEIRFAAVSLQAPHGHRGKPPLAVWAVLAQERAVPAEVKPLEWLLLTTVPVATVEQAVERLQWYAQRWNIEVFHRTLKSGCRIEDRQLGTADRLEACLAIDLVVAWRIHHLTKLGREVPQAPCTVCFEQPQWQSLMIFTERNPVPPREPPTLREAIRRVAGLGGFLGRKGDGEPGTECLWRGLQRLDDITEMFVRMRRAPHRRVSSREDSG